MRFVRKLSLKAIEGLKKQTLFKDHLHPDVLGQNNDRVVFPAVRDERIDFYWGGSKLFSYSDNSGFQTNHKFASVLLGVPKNGNISEKMLKDCKKIRLINNFSEGYERIKENCKLYSGKEDTGISWLYENYSCAKSKASVVVLDIEAAFEGAKNQIDIVAFDTDSKKIRFIETKHFSNSELRTSSKNDPPDVVEQIKRYSGQIARKSPEIIEAYRNHVTIINSLFSATIPEPEYVDNEPILLIFGYSKVDESNLEIIKGKIQETIQENDNPLRVFTIGGIRSNTLCDIFKGGKGFKAQW